MKISYRFVKGQAVVIEVDEDLGNVIIDLRHQEQNNNRKETRRRHLIPKNKDTGEEISIDESLPTINMRRGVMVFHFRQYRTD